VIGELPIVSNSILKKAIEEAEKSTYKQHRVGCVIFKGRKIHSVAFNSVRGNQIESRFKNFTESLHAEAHALFKCNFSLRGYSILVVRINKHGELRNAKPCTFCMDYITFKEIKHIYYSDVDGIFKLT
jgi:deoxycytidylate deaminase